MDDRKLRADPMLVIQVLGMTHGLPLPNRLGMIAGFFRDRPYVDDPLGGGPGGVERLVSRLDGFDCVTFAESVWALATSKEPADLEGRLRALRYRAGRLEWASRNHYMSQWIGRGEAAGRLIRVLPERWTDLGPPRTLSLVDGLPPVPWTPHGLPRSEVHRLREAAELGDLVCFLSTRDDLDVFHVGLLMNRGGGELALTHASRSGGKVVAEPLEDFLERNETPGLLVARVTDDDGHLGGER